MVKATKKDLEAKIAELEAKLAKLASSVEAQTAPKPQTQTPPTQTQTPPKPQPAATSPKGSLPKGMTPPQTQTQTTTQENTALETVWQNYPMTDTHTYKKNTPGYTPGPNRYYARKYAPRGQAPTQNWNLQKAKVTGYTAPSNQYFATRTRLAYHPASKNFNGFGLTVDEKAAEALKAQAPPKSSARGSLPKGF